jgi:hypothetical protein
MAAGAAGNNSAKYKGGQSQVKKADQALQKALKALGQSS